MPIFSSADNVIVVGQSSDGRFIPSGRVQPGSPVITGSSSTGRTVPSGHQHDRNTQDSISRQQQEAYRQQQILIQQQQQALRQKQEEEQRRVHQNSGNRGNIVVGSPTHSTESHSSHGSKSEQSKIWIGGGTNGITIGIGTGSGDKKHHHPHQPPYYRPCPPYYTAPVVYYGYTSPETISIRHESAPTMEYQVQQALTRMGYYHGAINGVVGKLTRKAIADYQYAMGLEPTGVIDDMLLQSLGIVME